MKVKELLKTVNVAWSPKDQYPILLAAGTAAQQLDATFNTSASLDLYSLNLQQPGYDMECKVSVPSEHRFHKIIWGAHGTNPAGVIVGGCDYGSIKIYSASKMLSRESDSLLCNPDRHTGPVRALDFNPFQSNLLASGATLSEIYIWDIVNTKTPMTPGAQSMPAEDVQYIQWNKQVQHILASTFSQRCVIWDLRKNEPIIKLTDANSKIRWKALQWHPEVATQLCLASEEDQAPVIQLWDLRFATSPLKTLTHHQRGILSIAWNIHDSDLLLSCARDNTIVCWNPNAEAASDQFLCELMQTNQWNFDVSWCPRSPGLIVGSSFDGHASVYSLLGVSQASETANKIVDSFPGMDPFTQAPPVVKREAAPALKKAPKWLRKPVGASFGFGGKLCIHEKEVDANNALTRPRAFVSQVITDPDMVHRSEELEQALKSEQFWDYCRGKADSTSDEHFKRVWSYVAAYFSEDITRTFLDLLGYNVLKVNEKLKEFLPDEDINTISDGVAKMDAGKLQNGGFDGSAAFDAIAQQEQKRLTLSPKPQSAMKLNTSDDEDGLITQAILVGNIEAAVSLCFASKRYADAIVLSMAGGPDLLARTQYRYFNEHSGALNSLINSVVSENWVEIVNSGDISCWKETLVGIFTHCNGEECSALCDALGDRLAKTEDPLLKKHAQICYICAGNLNKMISVADTDIQETVELVMVMKRALELQGVKSVEIDGNIAGVLSQYAEILASEGDLEAALNYVGDGQDPRIVMLRDRLYKALTYLQPAQPNQARQQAPGQLGQLQHQQQQQQQQQQQFNQMPQKPAQNYYNPVSKPNYQPTQAWNTSPLQNSYVMGGQQVQTVQPTSQIPPTVHSQPQILQPQTPQPPQMAQPPPSSGGSQAGSRPSSVGPQSRPKYMIDPSVKSAYSNYQQPYSPQSSFNQSSYQQYGNYPTSSYRQEPVDQFKPNIMTPALPANPPSIYDPRPQQQQVTPNPQGFSNEPAYQPGSHSSGWNDPPIAKSTRAQAPAEVPQQSPITHPLFGAAPQPEFNNPMQSEYHQGPPMNNYNYNQGYGQNMMHESQYKPFEPMKPAQQNAPEIAREVVPEKPKAPIPEQHLHLKTILDELRIQCYETAKNPAMKRKIEDVSKKLEVLYDCLRDNTLSQNTLQGLHQISQMIQSGNYQNGLAVHTQLVSGPDFSQIAAFMPGIKVLLQSALQLGVYIT